MMIKYFFLISTLFNFTVIHAQDISAPISSEEQLALPEEEPLQDEEQLQTDAPPLNVKPQITDAVTNPPDTPTEDSEPQKKRRRSKPVVNENKNNSEAPTVSATKHKKTLLWQIGPRFMLWQEKIKGSESGAPVVYNARFSAFAAAYSYKSSWGRSRRWLLAHEGDFIVGSVKASGTVNSTTDNLNSLIFFGLQLSPGIAYRTANATLIRFSAPVFYRKLSWDIGRTTLQLGDESVFDFGLGINGAWRMNNGSFFTTGLTARSKSVLWTLGWDFRL
jgi:hypothetical protein